eukprot:scaffold19184_cov46-Cyclotella_meneghiniana.AAC.13
MEGESGGVLVDSLSGDVINDNMYDVHIRMGGWNSGPPFLNVEQFKYWFHQQKDLNKVVISHSVKEVKTASHRGICPSTFVFMFEVRIIGKDMEGFLKSLRAVKGLVVDEVMCGVIKNVPVAYAVKRRRHE